MKLIKFYATWCEPCKMLEKVVQAKKDQIPEDLLQEVFCNGKILLDESLTDIRKRVNSYL